MLESEDCFRHIVKHKDMNVLDGAAPINDHAKISHAIPVLVAFVVFIQNALEVIEMFLSEVFGSKVIDAKRLCRQSPGVMGL
jgi:hypothetical protein